ncbi:MAG: hypothetical protein LC746_14125, partial [Acidobacteria bacterium]|nr:hypothetical protein [Acidobacteriota bacterium]
AEAAAASERSDAVAREPTAVARAGGWLTTILLLLVVGAAAFYGGLKFQQSRAAQAGALAAAQPSPTATPAASPYESLRRQVDLAPTAEASRMASENNGKPLDSNDPQLLSLYGRALLLSGKTQEAVEALRLADQKLGASAASRDAVAVDTRLALAAATLKSGDLSAQRDAAQSLSTVIENGATGGAPGGAGSLPSPSPSPGASASPSPFQ